MWLKINYVHKSNPMKSRFFFIKSHSTGTRSHDNTYTTATIQWPFVRDTRVSQYLKKHSPTHTYHDHQPSFICFLHLLWSIASSLFYLRAWQSYILTCLWWYNRTGSALTTSVGHRLHATCTHDVRLSCRTNVRRRGWSLGHFSTGRRGCSWQCIW